MKRIFSDMFVEQLRVPLSIIFRTNFTVGVKCQLTRYRRVMQFGVCSMTSAGMRRKP